MQPLFLPLEQPLNPFAAPVPDLFDLEFNFEDDLVGQIDFDFRDQRPSIDLISLDYFKKVGTRR